MHPVAASAAPGDPCATHAVHHGTAEPDKLKCGVGAACCNAASPPPATMGFMPVVAGTRFAAAGLARAPAFLTAGLERPPRAVIA
jgi:hypothetical protein